MKEISGFFLRIVLIKASWPLRTLFSENDLFLFYSVFIDINRLIIFSTMAFRLNDDWILSIDLSINNDRTSKYSEHKNVFSWGMLFNR